MLQASIDLTTLMLSINLGLTMRNDDFKKLQQEDQQYERGQNTKHKKPKKQDYSKARESKRDVDSKR